MRRALGPAVIQGAVRGAIAGLLPAAVAGVFAIVIDDRVAGLVWGAAIVSGATTLAVGDALSVRLDEGRARLARFLGGVACPLVGSLAGFSVHQLTEGRLPIEGARALADVRPAEGICAFIFVGGGLGLGQVVAGQHEEGAPILRRLQRALIAATVPWGMLALPMFLCPTDPIAVLVFMATIYGMATLLWAGHLLARPVGRAVGRLVEPETSGADVAEARERLAHQAAASDEARLSARAASDPEARRGHLERALAHDRYALATIESLDQPERVRLAVGRVILMLLELERFAEIEPFLAGLPDAEAVRAEVLRRRGDAPGALAAATRALENAERAEREARLAKATAAGVLVLACLDLGRELEARENLERVRRSDWWGHFPVLETLRIEVLERVHAERRPR